TLIPLILPLTILVSSIMVFGNFAENYEFAAMKSTGISLQRAMRSLTVFIVILGFVSFIFANNVIPAANFNFYNLRKNIAQKQPALAIATGQFNQLGDINIKVEDKSGDRGQYLDEVVIHKKTPNRPGNYTVYIANNGELVSNVDSNVLKLVLYDGHYYDEIYSRDFRQNQKRPFVKSSFEELIINVDLAGINDVDMEDMSYDNRFNMLNISSLNYTIDTLKTKRKNQQKELSKTLYDRTNFANLADNISPREDKSYTDEILDLFDSNTKIQLLSLAENTLSSTNLIIETRTAVEAEEEKWLNKHIISLHEKYSLGFACIILFFVGAPLGALIRKGGMGLPMVIAILLFLTYHFLGIFAKNSSQDGSFSPVLGTWLSTLIMLPLSIYLTSRATKDRGLFELGGYLDPIRKFLGMRSSNKVRLADGTYEDYSFITDYSNNKLIDIIKDRYERELHPDAKRIAYKTLLSNGISNLKMKERGVIISDKLVLASKKAKSNIFISKVTLIIYLLSLLSLILHFVFANNNFPQYSRFALIASIVGFGIYIVSFIYTWVKTKNYYDFLGKKYKSPNAILMIVGLPFYMISHFLLRNKINDDLGQFTIRNIK
ncbi:MAG: LptF/LptG family permease, partial [Flavobacteriaceae bacterium]|nr:LptF/LptG family permease [Flavobacteriaceae bacterium]